MEMTGKRWAQVFGYNRKRFLERVNAVGRPGSVLMAGKTENASRLLELIVEVSQTDLSAAAKAKPLSNRVNLDGKEYQTFAETRLEELEQELNLRAERLAFLVHPQFRFKNGTLKCSLLWGVRKGETSTVQDARIAQDLRGAMAHGALNALKRCQWDGCRKWFLKRVEDQRFCSSRCREKAFKSTPEFKAKRAKYMKQLRHDHRVIEQGGKRKFRKK